MSSNPEWVLDFAKFRTAWALTPPAGGKRMGEGVVVLHPDTGFTRHPELMRGSRYLVDSAVNFLEGATAEDPLCGLFPSHGTSTASVIVSEKGHPNVDTDPKEFPDYLVEKAVSGVAPRAKVLPCRVTNSVLLDDTSDSALARSIYHAIGLNKDVLGNTIGVVSVSLGRTELCWIEKNIKKALAAARKAGIVVCAAAGQVATWTTCLRDDAIFPGNDPNTICCAACDSDGNMLNTGFYGPSVDITAPGVNVWVARSEGEWFSDPSYHVHGEGVGTSYATAVTAGACALWQAYHGRAKLIQDYGAPLLFDLFKVVLKRSCRKPTGWNTGKHGAGILDAEALLRETLPTKAELEQILGGE